MEKGMLVFEATYGCGHKAVWFYVACGIVSRKTKLWNKVFRP